MTSFEVPLKKHDRAAGRFVGRVRRELLKALDEEKAKSGLNRSKIAEELGVHRSLITRQLNGYADITLSRVAELASVMGRRAELSLPEIQEAKATAKFQTTSSRSGGDDTLTLRQTPLVRWNAR